MSKLLKSKLDTIVVLDLGEYTISLAFSRWTKMESWLGGQGVIYDCSYGTYLTIPESLLMDSQDAIVFKLVFGL